MFQIAVKYKLYNYNIVGSYEYLLKNDSASRKSFIIIIINASCMTNN